jgi:hypothetical protein
MVGAVGGPVQPDRAGQTVRADPRWPSWLGSTGRLLFGPLPVALVLVGALAVQVRRAATQVADAQCGHECGGIAGRVADLRHITVGLAIIASIAVFGYWKHGLVEQRAAGKIPVVALAVFALAAALAPGHASGSDVAFVALLVAIVSRQAVDPSDATDCLSMRSFEGVIRLRGVRVTVVVVAGYALFLFVIPQSSPQAIDAILAWSSHPSYVLGGVASAALLSLVVHDSALRLASPIAAEARRTTDRSLRESRETRAIRVVGIGAIIVLLALWRASYVTLYGFGFVTGLVVLLLIVSAVEPTNDPDALASLTPEAGLRIAAWLRMIGQLPLVLFASGVTLALVEAFAGGDRRGVVVLGLGLLASVIALALLERGKRDDAADAKNAPDLTRWPALLQTQWWAGLIATILFLDKYRRTDELEGIALGLAAVLLAAHLYRRTGWAKPATVNRSWLFLRYLGFVPIVALAVGTIWDWPGIGLGVSIASFALAIGYSVHRRGDDHGLAELWHASAGRGLGLPVASGAGIALFLCSLTDIVRTSTVVGTIAAINLAAAAIIAILHALVSRVDRWRLPSSTRCRRRIPILTILAAWAIVAVLLTPPESHRMLVMSSSQASPPTLDDLANAYFARPVGQASPGTRPLLLVASDGGGSRASYWTALVLDCIVAARAPDKERSAPTCTHDRGTSATDEWARARTIMLTSGVSGGGVGLAQYEAALDAGGGVLPSGWAENDAGYDMLRAPMTWGVTHDLVASLLGFSAPGERCLQQPEVDKGRTCRLVRALTLDRGTILARSIAGEGGRELLTTMSLRSAMATPTNDLPAFIDNATLAGGVARVLASPLRLARGLTNEPDLRSVCGQLIEPADETLCNPMPVARARDLVDVLGPNRDMSLFAASTLGARFPIITAPGYVASCDEPGTIERPTDPKAPACADSSSMSDGGFLENSGLLTIRDLLPDIRQRVAFYDAQHPDSPYAIYVVELDNHTRREADTGTIHSARVATTALNLTSARDFIEGYARESLIDYVGSGCYLRIFPGVSAAGSAPTGWLLSDDAEQGLAQSLALHPTDRRRDRPLRTLVSWIDGTTENHGCVPTLGSTG